MKPCMLSRIIDHVDGRKYWWENSVGRKRIEFADQTVKDVECGEYGEIKGFA